MEKAEFIKSNNWKEDYDNDLISIKEKKGYLLLNMQNLFKKRLGKLGLKTAYSKDDELNKWVTNYSHG